jgi:hypothetical protein
MNYPLISEYIESIKAADDNFEELTSLRAVLGGDGQPVMTSGNFAVVFKMKDEETGKLYALKCFTKEQEGREEAYHQIADALKDVDSPYFVSLRYLEKELFVDTEQTDETEFPVLLMDWVEGKTLDKYLRENLDDKYALEMLAYRFSQLAQWLIPQPFAHGDLKPDNILVRENGSLVLVDYDGMYVPAMKGQKARELGSPDFRHPLRTEDDFDEHIDDFSLVSILLSLRVISKNPRTFREYGGEGRLIFSEKDYRVEDIERCPVINYNSSTFSDNDLEDTYIAFKIVWLWKIIKLEHVFLIKMELPIKLLLFYREEASKRENRYWNIKKDEDGGEYSNDGKRLLSFSRYSKCKSYKIKEGTEIICEYAFRFCENLEIIECPNSLKAIGYNAFYSCRMLKQLIINSGIEYIGDFISTSSEVILPEGLKFIDNNALCLTNVSNLVLPKSLLYIYNNAFGGSTIEKITSMSPLFETDKCALYTKNKEKLIIIFSKVKKYRFPDSVMEMNEGALNLTTIKFEDLPIRFRYKLFGIKTKKNQKKRNYSIPDGVIYIPEWSFEGFNLLKSVKLPSSIEYIDDWYLGHYKLLVPKGCISKFEVIIRKNNADISEYTEESKYSKNKKKILFISVSIIGCLLFAIGSYYLSPPLFGFFIYCVGVVLGLLIGSIVAIFVGSKDGCDSIGCAFFIFLLCIYWGYRLAAMLVEKII